MKSLRKKVIRLLPLLLVVLLGIATPVSAAINQIILTETIFFTAEKGFYNESLQAVLVEENSPLKDYSETLSGHSASAAEIIWLGSQTIDYGFNPKVLLINLKVLGWLDQEPSELLTPYVQSMTEKLWEGYTEYLAGTQDSSCSPGKTVLRRHDSGAR